MIFLKHKFNIVLLIYILILLFSCNNKNNFNINNLKIPKYYKNYQPRKFWKSMGVSYIFYPQQKDSLSGKYKDTQSSNFLTIGEFNNNIIKISQKDRLDYFRSLGNYKPCVLNNNFEIYKSIDTIWELKRKPLYYYSHQFILIRDSICFSITYETFDKDNMKLKDYNKMIEFLQLKCESGEKFISKKFH